MEDILVFGVCDRCRKRITYKAPKEPTIRGSDLVVKDQAHVFNCHVFEEDFDAFSNGGYGTHHRNIDWFVICEDCGSELLKWFEMRA